MTILNTNTIILANSETPLDTSEIAIHTSEISLNNSTTDKVRSQIGFFLNSKKMYESPTNALKVMGFEKPKNILKFEYPINDINRAYFFDLKLKEYIMACFPDWNETKLIITTEPVIEE